jgi:hypothetical protein
VGLNRLERPRPQWRGLSLCIARLPVLCGAIGSLFDQIADVVVDLLIGPTDEADAISNRWTREGGRIFGHAAVNGRARPPCLLDDIS